MAETMRRCKVHYEHDEAGWWVASVRGIRGCRTQGRTLDEARRRIREALGLFVAGANAAELVDDVRLPAEARRTLARFQTARQRAERERERASLAAKEAIRMLRRSLKLSVRDAGSLLGLSHQCVQQIG